MPIALIALAQHPASRKQSQLSPFGVNDLLRWAPALGQASTARYTLRTLLRAGLVAVAPVGNPEKRRQPTTAQRWRLTAEGVAACKAAQAQANSQTRSNVLSALNKRPRRDTYQARLWALLRIRKVLTSDEAACVLADAGDDVKALQIQLAKYLSTWHRMYPEVLGVGARRMGRFCRYVLLIDSPTPPGPAQWVNNEAVETASNEPTPAED